MAALAMLVCADHAPLEDREKAFERVGMHVAPRPFKRRVVNGLVLITEVLVVLRAVGQKATVVVQQPWSECRANVLAIQVHRAKRAATLDKAQHLAVGLRVKRRCLASLRRFRQEGLVSLHRLAGTTQRASLL